MSVRPHGDCKGMDRLTSLVKNDDRGVRRTLKCLQCIVAVIFRGLVANLPVEAAVVMSVLNTMTTHKALSTRHEAYSDQRSW